jgi:uncharacterized protein (TIGR03083 family)
MPYLPEPHNPDEWNVSNPASKNQLLRTVHDEAAEFFALASHTNNWEAPTASGHWQVRDLVGHMIDVTEGYLEAFDLARKGGDAPAPLGLRAMAERADSRAQAFRSLSQDEALVRLRMNFEKMMKVFEEATDDEWTGFMPSHAYLGPIPVFVYATFHLVDYGIHTWDIREGLGLPNGLHGDTADLLAPIMFVLWQGIVDPDKLGDDEVHVGVRYTGRNGGCFQVDVTSDGLSYAPVDPNELDAPAVIEFDAASLVLTAYERMHGGTAYGDRAMADRYRSIFFTI